MDQPAATWLSLVEPMVDTMEEPSDEAVSGAMDDIEHLLDMGEQAMRELHMHGKPGVQALAIAGGIPALEALMGVGPTALTAQAEDIMERSV